MVSCDRWMVRNLLRQELILPGHHILIGLSQEWVEGLRRKLLNGAVMIRQMARKKSKPFNRVGLSHCSVNDIEEL